MEEVGTPKTTPTTFPSNFCNPQQDTCPPGKVSVQGVKSLWGQLQRFSSIGHWGH